MKKAFILFKANNALFGVDIQKVISIEKKGDAIGIPK